MNALVEKAREIVARVGKRPRDNPEDAVKPAANFELVTAARHLTPAEIMAVVEAERNDPKHQAEIEYYRAKCSEYWGG